MKVEVELRDKMSRKDTFQALQIGLSAVGRLAHRMTDAQLQRAENIGAAVIAAVDAERDRRSGDIADKGGRQRPHFEILPPPQSRQLTEHRP